MTIHTANALADRLLHEGLINAAQHAAARGRAETTGARIEDALVDSGALDETELLKFLARTYRTRFVITSKLGRVEVDRALLELVPQTLATALQIFPVVVDMATGVLSVVAADAGDPELAREIRDATGAREVKVYVARPAAIQAAIAKYYGGDLYAFAHIDVAGREQAMSLMDMYDKQTVPPAVINVPAPVLASERGRERVFQEGDFARNRPPPSSVPSPVAAPGYQDTVTVLVSLMENSRAELRGHSSLVARWMRKLAERIRVAPLEADALTMAALIHDLGKVSPYHLTALNVAQYDSHRVVAAKVFEVPLRLFEGVPLGATTLSAVHGMYERFDGTGVPDGAMGKDIPLGARLLAIADTYADLTHNARNPYRRVLSPAEACDVMARQRGTVFDPNLLDLLRQTVTGDDLRAQILSDQPVVLLAEPDPEETTVLEIRLVEQGFDVRSARSAEQARRILETGQVDVVISETDLAGVSGIELLAWTRTHPWGATLPWLVHTRQTQREAVTLAYDKGATDYLVKPVPMEVLSAKIHQAVAAATAARAPRGVTGSLSEMGLTDIVQMLAQGRKTGQLRVRSGAEQGEIHFQDGAVCEAIWASLRGESAFYAMVAVTEGDFALDPTFKPVARAITLSVESLLLEGLRRMDEARASST